MPLITTQSTSFGRPATEALLRAVRALEGDDPLTPVTVVVPSNLAGLTARRLLAGGVGEAPGVREGSSGRRGLVNIDFVTPYQLAARLGTGAMAEAGRLPVTGPVLHAAVRAALKNHVGTFEPVARHVATELAVARTHAELSRVRPDTLDRLRNSDRARTRDLVALVDDVRSRLAEYHDEDDLVHAALAVVESGDAVVGDVGSLVLYLLDDLSPALVDLLRALASRQPTQIVVGLTGDDEADAGARAVAEAVGADAPGPWELDLVTPATRLIEAADPDEEVRAVVRAIAARIDAGQPLDRVAVLYPVADPYLRTLHDQLNAADIAHNGPGGRRLADSVVGRLALRLLEQVAEAAEDPGRLLWRQHFVDIISAAPVRDADGRPVPATSYDLLSRRAGVIGGPDDWADKLDRHQENLHRRLADEQREGSSTGRLAALEREADECGRLRTLVSDLAGRLDPAGVPASWRDRSAWLRSLLVDLLPGEQQRGDWPERETAAADSVLEIVDRVAVLDGFDPGASFASFARTVQSELEAHGRRWGRVGDGVLVAPLAAAVGLDVDAVFLLGCNEGVLPPVRREDALLPDDERRRAGAAELPLRRARTVRDRRDFLAVQHVGGDDVVLIHSAGDHRTGKTRTPSRWLLEVAGMLVHGAPTPLVTSDWPAELTDVHPLRRHLLKTRSYREGLTRAPSAGGLLDRDLASLSVFRDSGQPFESHHLVEDDPVLAAGLTLARARRSPAFTRFDGNVAAAVAGREVVDGVWSATRLETWATCPMRYFLGNELGLSEVERPEEIIELGALDRGSLVHEILEEFLTPVVALPPDQRPQPGDRWTDQDRRRLLDIATSRFLEYEQRGLTGKALLWKIHRQQLLADLEQWLQSDNELRAELGTVPEAVEMRIGFEDRPPATVALDDGRELRFRGFADRVDRRLDGTPVVIDYKTGKTNLRPKHLDEDPVQAGTKLQLGLYAEAARQHFGHPEAGAYYWFISSRGGFKLLGYDDTPDRQQRFREVVSSIVAGIESGLFVSNSGPFDSFWGSFDQCGFCDFDRLCPRDRDDQSAAKQADPAAARFAELAADAP